MCIYILSNSFDNPSLNFPYRTLHLQIFEQKTSGWWFEATFLKDMSSSIGMSRHSQLDGKIKIDGNQTTNQI